MKFDNELIGESKEGIKTEFNRSVTCVRILSS